VELAQTRRSQTNNTSNKTLSRASSLLHPFPIFFLSTVVGHCALIRLVSFPPAPSFAIRPPTMSKRRHEQLQPSPQNDATSAHRREQAPAAVAVAAAIVPATASASRPSAAAIAPLPEQQLGRKRARHFSADFNWLSLLATVELQLVLRCLGGRSRLRAARCNKQLYSAACHQFAWPPEQMLSLEVVNNPVILQLLGARVRASLLRLSAIHLRLQCHDEVNRPPCSEVFGVPNVHAITVAASYHAEATDLILPMLRHPCAPQLRFLDISSLWRQRCSAAELQQLQVLPRLHSLTLSNAACRDLSTLELLSELPSLTHLSLCLHCVPEQHFYSSLPLCVRLLTLHLGSVTVCAELANCLAHLPLLQRLHLNNPDVAERTGVEWTTFH
jgi:hypothetical protein